jgi:hypothetical protein
MVEEIQKIKAEELKAIRLVFPDTKDELGQIVELTMSQAKDWADKSANQDVRRNLRGIIDGLTYFSRRDVQPAVEFILPITRR